MEERPDSTARLSPTQRRQLGSYYTPAPIVRFIVKRCLRDDLPVGTGAGPRILDPACGDGVFLAGVFDRLAAGKTFSQSERLAIVREHIFGVDIDPPAVMAARATLREKIAASNSQLADETEAVLAANIRVGNALVGPDFSPNSSMLFETDGFSWRDAFPDVAAAGGFDVILGNPPYRRELDAKELFEEISGSPLGKKWRQPRMDLWYYFLHRGLDLLKPGGVLSFIVNSYWTASASAGKLIARLQQEANLDEFVLLGIANVFANVRGRHLIFRLHKERGTTPCQVISLEQKSSGKAATQRCLEQLENLAATESYEIPQQSLYSGGRLTLAKPSSQQHIFEQCVTLGECFETAQGMAENPPRINRRLKEKLDGRFRVGDGVFVLTSEEVERLEFDDREQALLRPYYETASLDRYQIPAEPTHQVLYLTRETAPRLEEFPTVCRHLEQFRSVMEQRRETRLGMNAWWHLHWPRQERLFTESSILSVQMGRVPRFALAANQSFVGFSVNVILARTAVCLGLETLVGILNSATAADWFARHAKHRGVNLEINLGILRQFPLPPRRAELEVEIAKLVEQRQSFRTGPTIADFESRINKLVAKLYRG